MATYTLTASRRRRWPWITLVLAVVLVALWTVAWHYAAGKVDQTIAGWREREAKVGRVYTCVTQTIGGFPFRINVQCSSPSAEFRNVQSPMVLKWKDLHVTANVFSPTRLVAHLTGPMMVGPPDQLATYAANWKDATVTMLGLPTAPERVTLAIDQASVERVAGGGNETVFKATSAELAGRMVEGSAMKNPVIEFTLKLNAATAPRLHQATATPIDADVAATLRGLRDFAPKSWRARFQEVQAAGGGLEVTNARLQQGEIIAVTTGNLGLTQRGRLNGELRTTVVAFEKLVPVLGIDKMVEQATANSGQLNNAMGALDRLVPGLGTVARQNAGPAMVASLGLLGQPAELEGKKAMMMPLKFTDGMASIGPIPLGPVPALY
jgi:hypothetical protein